MDSHFLAGVVINLILVCLGGYLVMRGKSLKSNLTNQKTMVSPNALIIIGVLLIIINVLQIIGFAQ
jgi:hypothetical protein